MQAVRVASLRKRADLAGPEVRTAALLRIARVQSAFDREESLRTFDAGLEAARRVPGRHREWLIGQARLVAAAVAPHRIDEIPADGRVRFHFGADRLLRMMLDHGQFEAGISYVLEHKTASDFPFSMLGALIHGAADDTTRVELLRAGVDAWRDQQGDRLLAKLPFLDALGTYWKLLPRTEVLGIVHAIVEEVQQEPEVAISAIYDPEQDIEITSERAHTLFQIWHVLRRLDPNLAERLATRHEQLGKATRRFPNGMESVMEEAHARMAEARSRQGDGSETGGGYCLMGSSEDFPIMHSLIDAGRDGEFEMPFEHALEAYKKDATPAAPNEAPKEFWRSTWALRSVLYSAGKRLGPGAKQLLERIPDCDLRLFAAIEFEAALAGLPEFPGVIREQRRPIPASSDRSF